MTVPSSIHEIPDEADEPVKRFEDQDPDAADPAAELIASDHRFGGDTQ